jgi:hypothetical protein
MADDTVKCPQCGTITHKSAAHTCRQVYVSEARLKQLERVAEAARRILKDIPPAFAPCTELGVAFDALDAPGGGEGNEGR